MIIMYKIVDIKVNKRKIKKTIIIFAIIVLFLGGCSMAKISENFKIKGQAEIAEPIFIVENNPSIDITGTKRGGEYAFKIKNYNSQNKITDASLKYYIEILPKLDKSINVELYQNENKIELKDNKTEYIKISKNQKIENNYKIKIKIDDAITEHTKDILEKIQVRVHAEQEKA